MDFIYLGAIAVGAAALVGLVVFCDRLRVTK
jgi:hypothetical protein